MPSESDVRHLLRRAGFGGTRQEIANYATSGSIESVVDQILADRRLSGSPKYATPPPTMARPNCNSNKAYYQTQALGRWFLERMASSRFSTKGPGVPHPLREKLTFFWHGLLVSSLDKDAIYCAHRTLLSQHLLFRRHALGEYEQLLAATSKDPAMLLYLDNWLSTVDNPNENYARELLELFSLGVGNYTQAEVLAIARAGTGYTLSRDKKDDHVIGYRFDPADHDSGADKRFFGIEANWDLTGDSRDGDARSVIAHLCAADGKGPVAARMLARLLWEFFAHFAPPASLIDELAPAFLASGKLLVKDGVRAILTHPLFYSDAARYGKVKNPIEWVVMLLRALDMKPLYYADARWDPLQEGGTDAMGLHLFFQETVFGWWRRPETRWIGLPAVVAKANVIDAFGTRLHKSPKHPLWKLLDLPAPEAVDGLFALVDVTLEPASPVRMRGIELLEALRAEPTDRLSAALTMLKFLTLSPPAQVN